VCAAIKKAGIVRRPSKRGVSTKKDAAVYPFQKGRQWTTAHRNCRAESRGRVLRRKHINHHKATGGKESGEISRLERCCLTEAGRLALAPLKEQISAGQERKGAFISNKDSDQSCIRRQEKGRLRRQKARIPHLLDGEGGLGRGPSSCEG